MDLLEDKKTRRKFIVINFIRIAIVGVLLLVSLSIRFFIKPPFSIAPIILTLIGGFLLTLLSFPFLKIFKFHVALYYQLVVDIVVITILVYFSGGVESPFYFLYILPIIVTSVFLSKRDTIYVAALSYIIFGALSELMYLKITPFQTWLADETVTKSTFVYNLVMSMIAFSSVALISSYYFERIRKTGVELKNIQENLKDLDVLNSTVLEKMENGFLTCNSEGNIISYNEKSKSLLNLINSSNIFELFFKGSDYEEIERVTQLKNNKYYFEIEIESSLLGVSVSLLRNIYSFDKVFVFIITDLTEKRAIEEKLKEKEHFALIGEMSAGIAHEIRNPLASISGSVQFLRKEMKVDPEYQNLMDIIVKESNRLSKSVEEFLEFARITPSKKSQFKLSQLIDDVVELISLNHKEVRFVKKYSGNDVIDADKKKIEQLIWNLVTNSVKAINEKGNVEINIYENEGEIYLSILDNGIGIDKGEMENIYTPFYSRFSSGIGLGMTIVKRIIEEHNFEIKINSEKYLGTEVIVCFKRT